MGQDLSVSQALVSHEQGTIESPGIEFALLGDGEDERTDEVVKPK